MVQKNPATFFKGKFFQRQENLKGIVCREELLPLLGFGTQAWLKSQSKDPRTSMAVVGEPIVQALLECKYEVTGRKEFPQGFIAATGMTFLVNQGRIPTVIFGPGSLDQTHGVDEFVEIDQLETAVLVYARLISRILGA